ncbi:MAG TPA: hypothetical protein VG993_02265 [Actinomycetota bacterium]|nr:hypothetical protein [Actinomycetota bacterium]
MSNVVPRRYRGVAVTEADVPLRPDALRDHLVGREAYRRTEYIVVRHGGSTAVVRVSKVSDEPLFSPIATVEVFAGPEETVEVHAPTVDTGVPTQLARVALEQAPQARCVVVRGRYEHVNFILDPDPVPLRIVEVVPPEPAKLVDQVERVLDLAEDLPPVDVRAEAIDLRDLAASVPADRYLFPCRGSGMDAPGATVEFLDTRPPRADWVLVGCARSREIHEHFYGDEPPFVEMCPRELVGAVDGPTLTKCCMLEDRVERDGSLVVVPWGASLGEVREGLGIVLGAAEPAWAPA